MAIDFTARRLRRALALAFALALPASAQTVDVVFPGYRVHTVEDSTISTHQTYHVALEAALNWTIRYGRASRITLVGPVRVSVEAGQAPDTVYLTLPPDTVTLPCDCEPGDTVPPVDDDPPPPDDDDPVDPGDPGTPPDTVAPPPDTTITYPDPTDPSGAFFRVEWDYAVLHDGSQGRYPTTYGPNNGYSRQVTLAQPGPWGGTRALRNTFLPMPRTTQPQVGTRVDFPEMTPRLWLETWVRFSPNWTVLPTFRWPDNPDTPEDESAVETGNTDHKTLFVFAMTPGGSPWADWDRRWDIKFGPNRQDCVASGGRHGTMEEAYYEAMTYPAFGRRDGQPLPAGYRRCNALTDVWDGQWHQIRAYMETYPTPTLKVWLDGQLVVNSDLAEPAPMRATPTHRFWSVWFGGNRNSGPTEEMWFEVGPATFLASDPGW